MVCTLTFSSPLGPPPPPPPPPPPNWSTRRGMRFSSAPPAGSGRTAELVEANEREVNNHTFYDLEYAVHLEDRDRHELATVVVDRGRLYTLATSVNEDRWEKVQDLCGRVVRSLNLLI